MLVHSCPRPAPFPCFLLQVSTRPRVSLSTAAPQYRCSLIRTRHWPRLLLGTALGFILLVSVATVGATVAQTATANPTLGANQFIAGYSGNVTAGTTFTMLDALWNVPAVSCQPKLGGSQQIVTMIQANRLTIGVQQVCKEGSSTPTLTPFALYPPVNAKPIPLKISVKAGDLVYALIVINPTTNSVNGTLRDVTANTGVHYIRTVPNAAQVAQGFFFGVSRGGLGLFAAKDLAKFRSPITFEGCEYDLNAIQNAPYLGRIVMQDAGGKALALTSGLSGGGATFSVTWVRSA